jgi:aminoglycoside phosphotransferase (APT) family kinase protein
MASTPFTLAALATSAVPQLEVFGVRPHTSFSGGEFTSAVLATNRGEVIIRIPTTSAAEVRQSGELLGLAALTDGVREKLPFEVPVTLGITRAGDSRAVASTFLGGQPASLAEFESSPSLLKSAATVLAAIHSLPTAVVRQAGLTARDAEEVRMAAARLIRRAAQSGLLPSTVEARWQQAIDADVLWSFEPTVIHGSIDAESLLCETDEVVGVLGWSECSLGDPATDLSWLFASSAEAAEAALAHYSNLRDIAGIQEMRARAKFYHELDVAKWLLHGVDSHDQAVIDDAVSMLDHLVDRISSAAPHAQERPALSDLEVEQLLDRTPVIEGDLRSETAEFEALDEDRVFEVDGDFSDPADLTGEKSTDKNSSDTNSTE